MSLDVDLFKPACDHCGANGHTIFSRNITHNLVPMAEAAGVYQAMWRPEEIGVTHAEGLIEPLSKGLTWLIENETEAITLNPSNGWGDYRGLVDFVREYLDACRESPKTLIKVSR